MGEDASKEPENRIKVVSEPEAIPVYNCSVIISRLDNGQIHGQVANLDGIEVSAVTEREILQQIVTQFKTTIGKYVEAGQEIPWLDPPRAAAPDQVEKLIPVHL